MTSVSPYLQSLDRSYWAPGLASSLLQRVAAGDMAAVQACIDEYGGLIWSLARRLCASPAEAEDAVQEVFIALWQNAEKYDETKGTEVTFVAMIARRRLIDSGRKHQRRQRLIEEAGTQARPEPIDTRQRLAQAEEARQAAEAMERLSEDQQRVLKLAIHQGLTHEEIANTTGLPLGTVKTHARRGLIRVRELLAGQPPEQQTASTTR
ncbi:MAG: RNA polymerase sigma factor [Planctomycetota bacterium]